jgi:hypothetical protein
VINMGHVSAAKSRVALGGILVAAVLIAFPAAAQAHGPINPVATDYSARIAHVPAGLTAQVIDGDQAMWLRAPSRAMLFVLDPRGAPYLRFSPAGVAVNTNSELFYLNQTPVAQTPPAGLTRTTPPAWQEVSSGHTYLWHEGRLHAPAALARPASGSYAGAFSVPLVLNGRTAAVTGGVWYTGAPSIVWFWPIPVLLLCLLAARRLHDPALDRACVTGLTLLVALAVALATLARNLHGRPGVSAFGIAELAVTLAFTGWVIRRAVAGQAGFLTSFVLAFVALWEGITLLPTLTHGYVLLALPAFVGRMAAVICLGGGLALLLAALRLSEDPSDVGTDTDAAQLDDEIDAVGQRG